LATLAVKEARLSKEWLREHCRQHDLYMTPRLNTVLYLHHKAGANHNPTSRDSVMRFTRFYSGIIASLSLIIEIL
jgi:hypothetical protein